MKTVGLTGGIGTGKSTVAGLLRAKGVPVIDADQVAREVVAPGKPALRALVDRFGDVLLNPDGSLNRGLLRTRIAHDPDARRAVEAIVHPAIFEAIQAQLAELAAAGHPIAVVEAALMVETGSYRNYDKLLVVSCRPKTQLARVLLRDRGSEADARALMKTQLPLRDKEAVANVVIRNEHGLPELQALVDAAWADLTAALST